MTINELMNSIYRFDILLKNFDTSNPDTRELWRLRKEIFEGFKDVKFEERYERQKAWNNFISLSDTLREKQVLVNKENENFAEEANRKLYNLDKAINGGFIDRNFVKEDFTELRQKMNEIFEIIKLHRWPSKETKSAAWEKFNSLREQLRDKENAFYENIRNKSTKRIEHSSELTDKVLRAINACDPDTPLESLLDILGQLALYATGMGFLFLFIDWLTGNKNEKPENPLKKKSQSLNDIRKFINDNKEDITREDKQKIFSKLDTVQSDLNRAWSDYKEQRENKKHEWERNQRQFLTKLESRLANQVAFKNKLEGFEEKQQNFISKLEQRLSNQQDYLRKQESHLEDLEEKYYSAYSDSFKDRVSDWISETKEKISDIENDIEQIQEKIKEAENNISELPCKIRKLENEIEELEGKIKDIRHNLRDY